jgi:hypothetical protein
MMVRDARSAMGAYDETRLYDELERVTAEACGAARTDDGERLALLVEQGRALVELIERAGVPVDVGAVTRILDLDRELLGLVMARRDGLRRELDGLARARASLASYGAAPTRGPVYAHRAV